MEVVSTNIGRQKIFLDGFVYIRKLLAKSADQIMWYCVKLAGHNKCLSLLKTSKGLENPEVTQDHNHLGNIDACVVEKCPQDMRQKSRNTNDRPNQILTFLMATIPDEVKASMSRSDTTGRVRGAHQPKDAQSLQNMDIIGDWIMTGGDTPLHFLLLGNS